MPRPSAHYAAAVYSVFSESYGGTLDTRYQRYKDQGSIQVRALCLWKGAASVGHASPSYSIVQ